MGKMEIVFEITDKTGRKIHLSKERFSHIRQRHPDVTSAEGIEETLKTPLKIIGVEENYVAYYKHFKQKKESAKYLKIIVKYLNGKGYVMSIN